MLKISFCEAAVYGNRFGVCRKVVHAAMITIDLHNT
jgi:hypothetical protein